MIHYPVVMLHNLVLSLSDAIDLVHPIAAAHQQRVAYLSLRLARKIGFETQDLSDLMYAAALHDIGILTIEEKIDMMRVDVRETDSHVTLGADLLEGFSLFRSASKIVRHHHDKWDPEGVRAEVSRKTALLGNIVHLADCVERRIRKDHPILGQVSGLLEYVDSKGEEEFSPDLLPCIHDLSREEAFWLDLSSRRIYSVLLKAIDWPRVELSIEGLEGIGAVFSRVVDFRSAFTATHSIGVATTAEELARRMNFGRRECRLMRVAGYLHDLGKVAVPNSILEKPAKLDTAEFDVIRGHTYHTHKILGSIGGFEEINLWASLHHERMDGNGYPFRIPGENLSLGSRIMMVADVFTAVTEIRPYRRGSNRDETISILKAVVMRGGLDDAVVRALIEGYDEIDRSRSEAQAGYAIEYERRFGRSYRAVDP